MANYKMSVSVFTLSDQDREVLIKIAVTHGLDHFNVDIDQALKAAFRAGYDDAHAKALEDFESSL